MFYDGHTNGTLICRKWSPLSVCLRTLDPRSFATAVVRSEKNCITHRHWRTARNHTFAKNEILKNLTVTDVPWLEGIRMVERQIPDVRIGRDKKANMGCICMSRKIIPLSAFIAACRLSSPARRTFDGSEKIMLAKLIFSGRKFQYPERQTIET